MNPAHRRSITRRRFIQVCACTIAASAAGATGYVAVNAPLPAPQPE
ncbi:MAG: twin-arginine translocation signal domain-containing protein, partial [Roseiflexus sp.]|nr:twin-arginine translocation signal domain-containing protein [Roseiflexus sp.]